MTSVPPPLGSSRMPTRPSGPLKLTVLMVTVPPAPPTTLLPVRPSASLPTKKYTRFEAQVLALRADPATFTVEPEDSEGFGKWSALFSIDEMKEQIETVLHESPELESFVERLVPSVVDFTLLHVSTVKSTILEVGNIELFELNEVISSFLRIMLFFCILSSAVLPKNEKPITESGDEISYEGAKAKHPISLLLGLRRRSTQVVSNLTEGGNQQRHSMGGMVVARFVNGVADISAVWHLSRPSITRQSPLALCTTPIKCSITLGQSSELEKLVVSSPKASTNPLNISLTTEGGSVFPINDPIITITDTVSNPMAYCLAAMKSEGVNLIRGYSVGNSRSNLPVNSNPSCVPPRPALGPNSYTREATKGASPNGTQVNVLQPSASFSPKLHCNRNVLVAAALLFLLIL
ncbi:hypothetical protein ZEAMMB73_Zm00001d015822 [Zea mays]|uniref:Uncharacterized protein n=1 Tax=Zea mays TaxID=4577 RepID=A0A1D6H461_MAIZE|nr:hypothetical protein ZEAMMB73_Zm00001d015822 [Zea mays]